MIVSLDPCTARRSPARPQGRWRQPHQMPSRRERPCVHGTRTANAACRRVRKREVGRHHRARARRFVRTCRPAGPNDHAPCSSSRFMAGRDARRRPRDQSVSSARRASRPCGGGDRNTRLSLAETLGLELPSRRLLEVGERHPQRSPSPVAAATRGFGVPVREWLATWGLLVDRSTQQWRRIAVSS